MGEARNKKEQQDALLVLAGNACAEMGKQITKKMLDNNEQIALPARVGMMLIHAYRIALQRLDQYGAVDIKAGVIHLSTALEDVEDGKAKN